MIDWRRNGARRAARRIARSLRGAFHTGTAEMRALLARLRYRATRDAHVVSVWPNEIPALSEKVAVLVHYDGSGNLSPDVIRLLDGIRDADFSVILVSNAGGLSESAQRAARAHADAVMIRENVGYDFPAWRDALRHFDLPRGNTAQLLLINDSVIGPFVPLGPILARADLAEADVWGATDSRQHRHHLQSWFVLVGPAALRSAAWRAFWSGVKAVESKDWVIRRYELRLTSTLRRGGLRCKALWPYEHVAERALAALPADASAARREQARRNAAAIVDGVELNPTAELWRAALASGCPFLKRELLRSNPVGVADVNEWRAAVEEAFGPGAL